MITYTIKYAEKSVPEWKALHNEDIWRWMVRSNVFGSLLVVPLHSDV